MAEQKMRLQIELWSQALAMPKKKDRRESARFE